MSTINNGMNNPLGNTSGGGPGPGMMMNGGTSGNGTVDQLTAAVNLKNSSLASTAASTGKFIIDHLIHL
jgi:hypothetical protein